MIRGVLWYVKFFLACFGAGFCCFLFVVLTDHSNEGAAFSSQWGAYIVVSFAVIFSPLIWRKLK